MNIPLIFKKSLSYSCYGFCALTLLYSVAMYLINGDANMYPLVIALFFPFCFCLIFAWKMLKDAKLNLLLSFIIHFAVTMLSFWFFICYPHRAAFETGVGLIGIFTIVSVIYTIISVIGFVIYSAKKRKENAKKEYKSVYKNN